MRTWQNVKKKTKKQKKNKKKKDVRKVFMPTPLNEERAVNSTAYLLVNVSMSQYVYNKSR